MLLRETRWIFALALCANACGSAGDEGGNEDGNPSSGTAGTQAGASDPTGGTSSTTGTGAPAAQRLTVEPPAAGAEAGAVAE